MPSAIPLRQIEGKYEILEKIREGGMGAIYKVRHRLLDEVRVIKLMRPQLTEDEELKERFLREARLAIKLRHPNIAQLYDFTVDEESGTAYIVMEFIRGTTLEDLLASHGVPPLGLALEIAQQSLRALGYLHTKGFVHRDISPDNLMLAEDAEGGPAIKLIDLGIAKILGGVAGEKNLTHTGTFLGKVRYASPEQFGSEGAAQVDIRGDLYSFGLVLYELLTCRYPVQGRDPSSIIAGHLFREPLDFAESDPGGRIPEGLRAVVLKALAKHPADRYATAQEMSRALVPFRSPDDVSEADLRRVLSAPVAPVREEAAPLPGSTQKRLDEQFGLNTTPQPRPLEVVPESAVTPMPSPVPSTVAPDAALEVTSATIELQLQKGSLLAAETELRRAVDTFGEKPELRTLRDRLDGQHQREAELAAETRVRQARELFAAGDLEEARERLLQARGLDPGSAEAADLLAEVDEAERRREEEARRRQEEEQRKRQEEEARNRQEEEARRQQEEEARKRQEEEEARRRQEEEARKRQQEDEERKRQEESERKRQEEEARKRQQEDEARKRQEEKERKRQEEEARKRQQEDEARKRQEEKERKRQEEERKRAEQRRENEAREAAARAVPPLPPVPTTGRRPLWIGAAALAFGLAVFLGWWLTRDRTPHQQEQPAPSVQETGQHPTAAPVTGVLIVDAVPWGEIVEIVDAHGVRQPLGEQRATPLFLTLPPGSYTVTLRNPHFPQPVSVTAEVLAGAEVRSVAEIGRVSEEELFHALGW